MIKVIVNGAKGRMGRESVLALLSKPELFTVVAECDKDENLTEIIKSTQADVVVDFTTAHVGVENIKKIYNAGARPVVGTSGFKKSDISEIEELSRDKKLGGIIAPNFSLGAILMMRFSEIAARFLPKVEIIELHHDKKIDSPSGTAIKTAELIASSKKESQSEFTRFFSESRGDDSPVDTGRARGEEYESTRIHSVRLPGFVAHQKVIFGGQSETLTIHHDSIHREAFMPGVLFACERVMTLNSLVYGLENLIEL